MRPRYRCDYCKKSGGSAYHMQKHESGCTLNPNRKCGICGFGNGVAELALLMPDPAPIKDPRPMVILDRPSDGDDYNEIEDAFRAECNAALPAVRAAVENCPACIMAIIRQRGIPVPVVTDFNYKAEHTSYWDDKNAEQHEHAYY